MSNTDGDGSPDLFVARINATGTALTFASYLGGNGDEFSTGAAVAPNGDLLIAATSGSFDETLETGGAGPNPDTVPSGFFGQDGIVARIGESADLDLEVTDSPDPVIAGANLTYSITVENLGTADADNTTLTVSIFQSSFVSSTGTCAEDSGVVTCDVGTLVAGGAPGPAPAGASVVSFDLVIQVDPFFDGSTIDHTFDLSADQFDPDLSNNSLTVVTTVDFEADLEVTKTDSSDPITEGDAFDYAVTVTNNGPSGVFGVDLSDDIPLEVIFNSSDPDGTEEISSYDPKGTQLNCSFFEDLAAGESVQVTINVTAGPGPATATNTATVSSETADSNPGNNSADEPVEVTDVPDPVVAGTSWTYNVSVGNAGTRESTNTFLEVTLDPGLSLVSAALPRPAGISPRGAVVCTPEGNSVFCELGTIAAPGSTSVSIVTAVDPGQTTALSSQFDVSTDLDEQNELNNSATENTDVTALTDLFISKTDSPDPVATDPVGTGEVLTYTITATNLGPTNASGVIVEDTLPEGVIFFSSNPSICALNGSLSCTFGDLAAEQSKQVAVSVGVTALPGTTLSNTASISGSQDDPNSGNNSATELTSVELTADLAVELTHSPEVPSSGLAMTIHAAFRNLGPEDAFEGTAGIVLPGLLQIDSVNSDLGFNCHTLGNQVLCTFSSFDSGELAGVLITSIPAQGGDYTVSASIDSLSTDRVLGNSTDQIMFTVPTELDLSIVKTPRFDVAASERAFWYRIEIENVGNTPLADVTVTDELTAGLQVNDVTTEDPIVCMEASTSISCEIATLNPGEVMSLLLEVQLAGLLGPFLNTVEAAAEGDQDPENNSSTAAAVGAAPGDANADGAFNAADIVLLVLEINDGDGDEVFEADGGTFKGNPAMDVDGDGLITLADYDALVALIFPPSGTP